MTMSSDSLLPEILSRIFSLLHIEDRKTVRLVCKNWNDSCNCPAILKRERFVFRAGYPLETIDLFLRNCENIRNFVEFQGFDLDELSDDIWQIIGENIYSLKLFECTGTTKVTKNIFLHCLNMHSFNSQNDYQAYRTGLDDLYSPVLWDELIQLNVERRKVTAFHLFVGGVEIPKDELQKIFKIFPCIRNFGTGYPSYVCYIFNRVHQASLLNIFNPASIQELTINVPCSGLWIQEFSEVPELKLQKLETILKNLTISPDIFAQFLKNQNELKTLKITLSQTTETDYTKVILSQILSICTKLIDFRFKSNATLKIDEFYRVLRKVSESQLECFMIWFTPSYQVEDLVTFNENLPLYLTSLTNKRLRTLKLETGVGLPDEYCIPILQHFHDLYHLDIAAGSDKILQTIFKYHIHLQTLVLYKIDNCTAFGFTGEECDTSVANETSYSISRLQELKHLEVQGFLGEVYVEKTMRHFNFPCLKYLRLSLWGLEEEINLQFLPDVTPLVEVLIFDEVPVHIDAYSFLCQHMPRLKLLLYTWLGKEEIIKNLFIIQPSLKYAVDSTDNAYFYDRFLQTLSIVRFTELQFEKSVFCDFIRM